MNLMNLLQSFEDFLATNQIRAKKVHKTHKVHRGSVQSLIEAAQNCSGWVSFNEIKNHLRRILRVNNKKENDND